MPSVLRHLAFWLTACAALGGFADAGQAPAPSAEPIRDEVGRLVRGLDADDYAARNLARERLKALGARAEAQPVVAEEIARLLRSAGISLEVRHQLQGIQRDLPDLPAAPAAPEKLSPGEIPRLVRQLEDDSYAIRAGAAKRLEWLSEQPDSAGQVVAAFRERLSQGGMSADAWQWLEPTWQRAWGHWALTDPAHWDLAPVSQAQIERWIDALARPGGPDPGRATWHSRKEAEWQLRDVLVRDDYVPQVRRTIEARLAAADLSLRGRERLTELSDRCRPAMVAEFWQQRRHRGIQHLLVGVPSQTPGAPKASHFDRIDDETAHCVSGNNLSTGDYPVGVAIPHPNQPDALFHLVNLPTPRRRMAYDGLAKRDERQRLAELSRRTCDRFLRLKRPLTEPEILMLAQLDAKEMSRFAGEFLLALPDEALPAEGMETIGGRPSRHGLLCAVLAGDGGQGAVPGLLEAIARDRVLPPSQSAPYEWDWIAGLAIAVRDPWPEADAWLGGLIVRTEPLVIAEPEAPELGATAAAILLNRHGRAPTHHGLVPARDAGLDEFRLPLHRFTSPEARQAVIKWWEEQKAVRKAAG